MIRVPKKNHESLGLQHEHRKGNFDTCFRFRCAYCFIRRKEGIKVTHYIEDVKTFNECKDKDKFARCANLMKSLHAKEAPFIYF